MMGKQMFKALVMAELLDSEEEEENKRRAWISKFLNLENWTFWPSCAVSAFILAFTITEKKSKCAEMIFLQ